MNPRQFDGIAKSLSAGANRRGVLGVLVGGVAAVLQGWGGGFAHHKEGHCPLTNRCGGHLCDGGPAPHCEPGFGVGCSCVLSVEGCRTCVNERDCGNSCTSSADCAYLGPGAICEAEGCGNCQLTCMPPCPV